MYKTLQLNAMTRQPKIIQVLCRGIFSMLLYLKKYLTQAIQVTCFEILKTLICASSNKPCVLHCIANGKQLRDRTSLIGCSQNLISLILNCA